LRQAEAEPEVLSDWPYARLTPAMSVRHTCITMTKVTIRNLRNEFPKVKEAVEAEGEVIVTDNGKPRYKLVLYTPAIAAKRGPTKDYMARLRRHQPRPLTASAAKSLHEENRGER
jgi:antitoxin (DNA-binding transcriptional repressor) of toxin-antitoxin stability system